MGRHSRGKRPCCICRKWFQPDVRQKGRQKTCGNPDCMREQHRRKCGEWNKKNKDYFKTNYLDQKIQSAQEKIREEHETSTANGRQTPILPYEILLNEYGTKNLIILQYLFFLITRDSRASHGYGAETGKFPLVKPVTNPLGSLRDMMALSN